MIGVQRNALPGSVIALRLAEAVVEVNITAVDWLANFSNYGVTTKLRESYQVVKSASKIRIRLAYDNLTTS